MPCRACWNQAHAVKITRSRKTSSASFGRPAKPMMCCYHPEQRVDLICSVDGDLVCLKCSVTSHYGHQMIEVEKYTGPAHEQAQAATTIQALTKAFNEGRATQSSVEKNRDDLILEATKARDKIIADAHRCHAKAIQDIKSKSQEKLKLLQAQLQELSDHLEALVKHHNQVTELLGQKDHARAIQAAWRLKETQLHLQRASLSLQPVTRASLQFVALKELTSGISSIGQVEDTMAIVPRSPGGGSGSQSKVSNLRHIFLC
jgi:hypothetical protein